MFRQQDHRAWALLGGVACALLAIVLPATAAHAVPVPSETVIYETAFNGVVGDEWSDKRKGTTPLKTQIYGSFLGQFSNAPVGVNVSGGDESVMLTLSDLTPGTYHVTFDLLIIKSWDGIEEYHDAAADRWSVGLAGHDPLLLTSFSNNLNRQTYPDPFNPALHNPLNPVLASRYTGSVHPAGTDMTGNVHEKNQLGFTFPGVGIQDAVYKMDFTFPLTDPNLVLKFAGLGLDGVADAGWGLDNVVVARVPEPSTVFSAAQVLAVLGALAVGGVARRRRP